MTTGPDPDPRNRRILVVDDNQAIHDDFRKILAVPAPADTALDDLERSLFGGLRQVPTPVPQVFDLDSAYQGRDAVELVTRAVAERRPYAVAFVDMRMPPGWDGLQTIERIWEVDPDVQVVVCSAYSDYTWGDFQARLGERDALLIVKKPFDSIEVVQCAHALTTKWDLTRRARAHFEDLEQAVRARTIELQAVNVQLSEEIAYRDRVETELRLAQKLEAVGQLAAGIAHEINTPIQYVGDSVTFVRESVGDLVGMAGAMLAATSTPRAADAPALGDELRAIAHEADLDYLAREIPEALDAMQDGVDRVAAIVRAMKELAHPGPRDAAAADLNRALANALQVSAASYRYVADVVADLGDLPPVTCYLGDLNQVFLNLIVNAAHAMDGNRDTGVRGRLGVRTRVDGPDVVIEISDTGCGIPESVRDRVFDAFFTTKDVGRGTGQGLAISRAIVVDRHRGRLTFETEVGAGTTFHVRLPIAGPADRARRASAEARVSVAAG